MEVNFIKLKLINIFRGLIMSQENNILKIMEEFPDNKKTLKYGDVEKITIDGKANIEIKNGWLRYINLNDNAIRYINTDSIYEIIIHKD